MAYETGIASSPTDLLQKLVAFLENNGWTTIVSQSTSPHWRYVGTRGGKYVNIVACMGSSSANSLVGFARNEGSSATYSLQMTMGNGYNASASAWRFSTLNAPCDSGGSPTSGYGALGCHMILGSSPILHYDFFANDGGDDIHIAVERTAGIFMHLGWGLAVKKFGTWDGGAYFYGNASYVCFRSINDAAFAGFKNPMAPPLWWGTWNYGFIEIDAGDTIGIKWHSCNSGVSQGQTGYRAGAASYTRRYDTQFGNTIPAPNALFTGSYCAVNGLRLLVPIMLYVWRGSSGNISPIGYLPNIFLHDAYESPGTLPGRTVLTKGADSYMMLIDYAVRKVD